MEGFVRRLAVRVLDLVFPRFCLRCGAEGTAWCAGCAASFVPVPPVARCPFCGADGSWRACASCRGETYLDGLVAAASYGNATVREALTSWKYHGDPETGRVVDLWIRQAAAARGTWPLPSGATVAHVPLHASRRRHRGFDQAEEVARSFAAALGLPSAVLLARETATESQAKRSAAERLVGDLDGAFVAVGSVPRKVILCDDVCTSGATMDAAAKALKEAGAETVWGFAVARGGGGN
jgi:predicted amidophosphoribosyltransferase